MYPVLFRVALLGRVLEIHAFGLMVALGCAFGTLLAVREARLRGVDTGLIRDLCLWGLLASLVGARIVDVLGSGREAWDDCLDAIDGAGGLGALWACTRPLRPWEGGLVFYGGVLGGLLAIRVFTRRHGMDMAATMDLLAPSLPLGHAFGRLGCLLAGCCWGKPSGAPWAISFGGASAALQELAASGALPPGATRTPPLHPTQIYEALGELLLFALLMARRRRTRFGGELALTWLAGYSALRLVIELFRGDPSRGYFVALRTPALNRALGIAADAPSILSTSQGIALVVLALSVALLLAGRRRSTRSTGSLRAPEPAPRG